MLLNRLVEKVYVYVSESVVVVVDGVPPGDVAFVIEVTDLPDDDKL